MDGNNCISLLYGRLGNILFQLAAGLSYSKKYKKEFHCIIKNKDITPYSEYKFFAEMFPAENIVKCSRYCVIKEDQYNIPKQLKPVKGNVLLDGYFQSDIYIDKEYIRELFAICDIERINLKWKYTITDETVGISVRRGDYLKKENRSIFNVLSKNFYKDVYKKYFNGLKCIVSSDDIDWCKKNFDFIDAVYIDNDSVTDMRILSLCKHHILSSSTFSWWSSWLEEKTDSINIVPNPWFKNDSGLIGSYVAPKNWIREYVKPEYIWKDDKND